MVPEHCEDESLTSKSSHSQQLNTDNRALYEALTLAIQKLPTNDNMEASLIQKEACQRVRGEFYKVSCGRPGSDAKQIVQSIIEMGMWNNNRRSNSALLLNQLCTGISIKVKEKHFIDIILDYILSDYTVNINMIKNSRFPITSFNVVLLYVELFVYLMSSDEKRSKGLYIKTKRLIGILLENTIGSLKCLVNIVKIAGEQLYKGEKLFGIKMMSMNKIFNRIKEIIVIKDNTDRCTRRMLMCLLELRMDWHDRLKPTFDLYFDHRIPIDPSLTKDVPHNLVSMITIDLQEEPNSNQNPLESMLSEQFNSLPDQYFM